MKVGDLVWIRSEVGMIVNVRNGLADVLIGGEVRLFHVESLTEWLDLI